jgi:hypothetical protein
MLPNLDGAQPTLRSLHTVARLLGAVRLLVYERQPNFLELGLRVGGNSLSTDRLPGGSEVFIALRSLKLMCHANGTTFLDLEGRTQAQLLESVLGAIYFRELEQIEPHVEGESYTDAAFRAVGRFTNRIKPKRHELTEQTPLSFDPQAAADYAKALYAIFTGVARFRARLNGSMTPVVVWPEHFDLSFLWFWDQPDEQHPHLNFGFAPYSYGINYPYLYAYAYPYPAGYDTPKLPEGARWNTEGWTGMVLPYAEIARHENAEAFVEDACELAFRSLRALLG